jgi:hypothetical protein
MLLRRHSVIITSKPECAIPDDNGDTHAYEHTILQAAANPFHNCLHQVAYIQRHFQLLVRKYYAHILQGIYIHQSVNTSIYSFAHANRPKYVTPYNRMVGALMVTQKRRAKVQCQVINPEIQTYLDSSGACHVLNKKHVEW